MRDDEDAMQELGDLNVTEVSTTETRANYLLLGYFLGQSGSAIHQPDKFLRKLSERLSAKMAKAGAANRGKVRSPATKAILLAFKFGHATGEPVCRFFDSNSYLDEVDVDIELDDSGEERMYKFRGLHPDKDTTLSVRDISVRVSQLKKNYLTDN